MYAAKAADVRATRRFDPVGRVKLASIVVDRSHQSFSYRRPFVGQPFDCGCVYLCSRIRNRGPQSQPPSASFASDPAKLRYPTPVCDCPKGHMTVNK